MKGDLPLLDAIEGAKRKEAGMARAIEGAGDDWATRARAAVLACAEAHGTFTSDEVWASGLPKPAEPRALGAVFSRLARAGLIVKTGFYVKTLQASRNNAPIAVWRKA